MYINYISPNDTIGNTDSESIQNAVDKAAELGLNKVVIPRMNERVCKPIWIISETIKLPSNMMIVLDNCFMQMADDVVGGFFKSANLFTEDGTNPEKTMRNIHICGEGAAILDGGKPTSLNEETQREIGIPVRLNSPIILMNVEDFSIENIRILHQRYWGIRLQFCSRGSVRNIFFDICRDRRNQDGVDVRNGCHDILIENISGQTGDDMVALSALDNYNHSKSPFEKYDVIVKGKSWDIHDITIRNVSGAAILHPLVAVRNHNGAKIYNINIENVRDTAETQPAYEEGNLPLHGGEFKKGRRYALVMLGHNHYASKPSVMGDTYNITMKDLYCSYSSSVVLTHATIKNCSISNVFASGKCESLLTVIGNEWGEDTLGVQINGLTVDGVHFECNTPDSSLINYRFMREGDYVKNLLLNRVVTSGVERLATLHKRTALWDVKLSEECVCPDSVEIVEPEEVKQSEIFYKPFKPDIQRKYN